MAEVLGVVASGISVGSLAIQIIASVQQVLDFWSTIRDAPENVRSLLKELKLLGHLLSEFDRDSEEAQLSTTRPIINEATESCQIALDNINRVLIDLERGLQSTRGRIRQWTALKAAMKDKRMEKSLARLERAKSMLNLAYQCYNKSKIQALKDFQRQKFKIVEDFISGTQGSKATSVVISDNIVCSIPRGKPPSTTVTRRKGTQDFTSETSYWLIVGTLSIGSKTSTTVDNKTHKEIPQSGEYYVRVRSSIIGRAFEILSTKIYGFWQYSFRSYRIFTVDDPIYKACTSGDTKLVQQLCVEGHATPYDTTFDGWSLLHVAATYAHPLLCKWLISQGVDGNVSCTVKDGYQYGYFPGGNACDFTPLAAILHHNIFPHGQEGARSSVLNTLRVLIEYGNSDPMLTDSEGRTVLHLHRGSLEEMNYLLSQEQFQVDLLQRTYEGDTVSEYQAGYSQLGSPKITKLAWEFERVAKQPVYGSLNPTQESSVHGSCTIKMLLYVTKHLKLLFKSRSYDETGDETIMSSISLVRQLIECGTDYHSKRDGLTPLAQIAGKYISDYSVEANNAVLARILRAWVKLLRDAGVNITDYFAQEKKHAVQRKKEGDWRDDYWLDFEWRVEWGFHYSERPEDCFISGKHELRKKVEIWHKLDSCQRVHSRQRVDNKVTEKMPGAWTQDLSDDEDSSAQ